MATSILKFKQATPWWAKVAAKLMMSRLPIDYSFWRALSVTRFGGMDRPSWAYETFRRHFDAVDFSAKAGGFGVLEIGPGDSLFSALIAKALGAARVWLIDVGRFAADDPGLYRSMAEYLATVGLTPPDLTGAGSLDAVLSACDAHYGTDGLASLRQVPDASVDFLFSNAVLQHVRRSEFAETLRQTRRVLKPGGACSHTIGLWDHISDSLHHLRFPSRVWETSWVAGSGFYTNRLRFAEVLEAFREAGFQVELGEVQRWDALPLPRRRLHADFAGFPDDDLRVRSFNVVLRPV